MKQETLSGSGIRWAICKFAPRSRQITTPAPHNSVFTGRMPFLPPNQQCQSTEGFADHFCYYNNFYAVATHPVVLDLSMWITWCIAVSRLLQPASLLWELTCTHMGLHSITCCLAEVTFCLYPSKAGSRFCDPGGMLGWVDLVGCLTCMCACQGGSSLLTGVLSTFRWKYANLVSLFTGLVGYVFRIHFSRIDLGVQTILLNRPQKIWEPPPSEKQFWLQRECVIRNDRLILLHPSNSVFPGQPS